YTEKRTEDFCPCIPPGVVKYGELWVRSRSLDLPGLESTCFIKGRFDIVAELDDGSYAVLDFKTGKPKDDKTKMYARQLHAYAMALERPARNALELRPVSKLGLLYFTPDGCTQRSLTRQSLEGELACIEVARHDDAFLRFLAEVVRLLDGPLPPPEPDRCDWCKYRTRTGGSAAPGKGVDKEASLPSCPVCKGPMQLKRGRFGEFWSCMNYPDCKGTRNA
ncbi:MAG: PD-(D/E)XK nuclease family protein, partial [Thermodesulfobacteriota bacterium]|nr:PD-(D/E)XK nuclease family protein [Thermodesulfobacteriota bacterium]